LSGGDRLLVAACRGDREAYALGDRGVLTEVLLQGLEPLQYPSGEWVSSWTLAEFIEKQLKANPLLKRQIPLSRQFGEKIHFWQGMKQGVRHNLPQPDYGHFIGREQELTKVIGLLNHSRSYMITIDGIGGIGKSALALEIAHRLRLDYKNIPINERFEAIIWTSAKRNTLKADRGIVNRQQKLQTLDDICKTIAITLGIEESVRSQPEERFELVCRELTKQRTLLIVDNLETVDDEAVMEFLQDLLPEPTKAIVTTRHRINVAYPVRLRAMPWEDAEKLIEQECRRKEVTLTDEQKRKLYDRTGGVPLAIVWTVAKIGFGSSIDTILARLGNRTDDIARFCFEETIERIKNRDAYKLLLALALFKGDANREELGYVAGFGEDELSQEKGLEELEVLSLVHREGGKFSMLPLTKEYTTQELEIVADFENETICRLIDYYIQNSEPENAGEYLARYKNKLSQSAIEKSFDGIWYKFEEAANYCGDSYLYYSWVKTVAFVGGDEAVKELKKGFYGFHSIYDPDGWGTQECINAISRLGGYDILLEKICDRQTENWIKSSCIEALKKSKSPELVKCLREAVIGKEDENTVVILQEIITHIEQS